MPMFTRSIHSPENHQVKVYSDMYDPGVIACLFSLDGWLGATPQANVTMDTSRSPQDASHLDGTEEKSGSQDVSVGEETNKPVVQDLRNAFSNPDPAFHVQRKLINLCQTNRSFAAFFTDFTDTRHRLDSMTRPSNASFDAPSQKSLPSSW